MGNQTDGWNRRDVVGSIGAVAIGGGAAMPLLAADSDPIVQTRAGKVRGGRHDGVLFFKGVRYGAPTRRFMPPRRPDAWTDVKDAIEYGNSAPQAQVAMGGGIGASWRNDRPVSEDCLFLNVWTRGLDARARRPVMVWFHGGGWVFGSGSENGYEGTRLANRGDVVVVTVNHRLNLFGYSYLAQLGGPAYADSGNAGTLDMVLALQWVRDNIAAFGGDPGQVTIFGESGGGDKVSVLMAMPMAKGLFKRVIAQSNYVLAERLPAEGTETSRKLMAALSLKADQVGELATMPMERIIAATGPFNMGMSPVVDGRSLPHQTWDPVAPPESRDVPLLVGGMKDEAALFAMGNPGVFETTWEQLPAKLAPVLKPSGRDPAAIIAMYRRVYPMMSAARVLIDTMTAVGFRRNAILQAERKAAQGGAPAYMYLEAWETPVDGGKYGAPHALDVGLVFDNVARSSSWVGSGAAEAQQVADAMSEAWIRFARTGNPGWPAYDTKRRATMVFNVHSEVVDDPRREEREMLIEGFHTTSNL